MNQPDSLFSPALEPFDSPRTLQLFLGYRVLLAIAILLAFYTFAQKPLGDSSPGLFALSAQLYLVADLFALLVAVARPQALAWQALLAVIVDIAAISLMMFASGGVGSGLGMLIAISIALGSMVVSSRHSLLLAAIASLSVLGVQYLGLLLGTFSDAVHLRTGLLGVSFFALAILAHQLSARARRSEQLASQRGEDLINLAQLNDFVIQQMQAGIIVVDTQREVQLINEAAWVLLGMPDGMRGHPLEQLSPHLTDELHAWSNSSDYRAEPFRVIAGGREIRAEFTNLGDGGERGTLIVLEDTALLTAQAQQLKLASLGRLTAGIAHEIRNPLGAISHAAQLLDESTDLNSADRRMSDIIQQNAQRVNEVIQNILKLSRQNQPKPKPLCLTPWLEQQSVDIALSHRLEARQIRVHIDPPGTTLFADAGQLRQVIEVLCDNAVRHFDREPEALAILLLAGITPESGGPFIEVQDNGKGIAPAEAKQLFEPFFTTRNEGTGLGLYIARQLSEANRANLDYQSLPNGGSCFRLTFPNPRRAD